jgi:hypothetical protein
MRGIAAAGTLIAAAAAPVGGAIAAQGGGSAAVSPGYMPRGPVNTCFWGDPEINPGPIDQLHQENNFAGPDTDTTYYYTRLQLPPGARVTLHGQYPHARFMSYTTYKTIGGVTGYPATALIDTQIRPDRGSVNPFDGGARRDRSKRAYTVTVSGQVPPANPAPNTLYTGQAATAGQTQQVELELRMYRPDRGYDGAGGVPLPTPTVTLADGTSSSGTAACSNLHDQGGIAKFAKSALASEGVKPALYKSLRDAAPAPHPATDPVRWYRFFNTQRLLEPFFAGTSRANMIGSLPTNITGGFYSTPNNAYMLGYVDRTIGPNRNGHNILVLHAKMPTHPHTYNRETKNDSAGTQMRFWSLCNYGSYANPPLLPANSACVFDERVPTKQAGYYTIVVSLSEDRPRNATPQCGVAWMDWGTAGDGQGRSTLDLLAIREQLDSPTYAQGIDKITTPDTEQQVMGAHYPKGTYMTKSQFQKRSCSNSNQ